MTTDQKEKKIKYSLSVSKITIDRIERLVTFKRHIEGNHRFSKSDLVAEAVQEKLKEENHSLRYTPNQQLYVTFNEQLNAELEKNVDFLRKILPSGFSKKKWVLTAIEEKLHREEMELQRKHEDLKNQ